MISEVENILNGQVERKVNADKVIGVSSANLLPDEKGEVPLSKQSAFDMAVAQTPASPVQAAPVMESPQVSEELDLGPTPEGPAQIETPLDTPVEEPTVVPVAPEQATPASPVVNDTISEAPVDVVAPTELEGVDFNAIIPNIPLVDERPQEEVKEPVSEAVTLPEMPNEILAEAPTTVDNNLFVDTPVTNEVSTPVVEEPTVSEPIVTSESTVKPEEPVQTPVNNEPVIPEQQVSNEEAKEEESLFPEMPELPVESQLSEQQQLVEEPVVDTEPTITFEGEDGYSDETLAGPIETSEEPAEEREDPQIKEVDISNEKLDEIINLLNSINDSLNYIKGKLEKRENLVTETKELPQANVVETSTVGGPTTVAPAMEEPALTNPALEVPAMGTPALEAPILDEPKTNEPAKQDELVDALSQIPGYDVSSVDETPIKGGMFI